MPEARVEAPPPGAPAEDQPEVTEVLLAGPLAGDAPGLLLVELPFEPGRVRPKRGDRLARGEWRRVGLKPTGRTDLEESQNTERGECELCAAALTLSWPGPEPLAAGLRLHFEGG